jgi:AhpD family alkylhydroperoxidase
VITNFPDRRNQLNALMVALGHEAPGVLGGFANLHKQATAPGALSPKYKELIALGIAVAQRCENCIAYHVHDALRAGANRGEIVETLGVAVMMGGGPASMYACEAFEALQQYEAENSTRS